MTNQGGHRPTLQPGRTPIPPPPPAPQQCSCCNIGAVNDALRAAGIEYPEGARGVRDLAAIANRALDAVGRVREIHVPGLDGNAEGGFFDSCEECIEPYPCPTIRALDDP